MKNLSRRLLTGILLLTLTAGLLTMPVFASAAPAAGETALTVSAAPAVSALPEEPLNEKHREAVLAAKDEDLTWHETSGGIRIQAPNGKYRKGFVRYQGKLYYFNSRGFLKTGFFKVDGKKYYASCNIGYKGKGQILTGLWKIGRHFYFLDPSSKPREGVLSTGFQKIKGRTYYFDKEGRMVNGWFTVSGNKYYASCNKASGHYGALLTGIQKIGNSWWRLDEYTGRLLGKPYPNSNKYTHMIDVSEHNGNIDFNKVKESGVKAVIIRAGFGDCDVDKYFYSNIKKAKAAGLRVGVYWFSYAYKKQHAINEANFCLRVIRKYRLDLPVYFDWEDDSMRYAKQNHANPGRRQITEMTEVFCNTIARGGYRPGYYFNLSYLQKFYDATKLKKYSTWYAFWGNNLYTGNIWIKADMIATPKSYDLWQFSACGKIPGIKGSVDCDLLIDPSILK